MTSIIYIEKRLILVDSFGSSGSRSIGTVVRHPIVVQLCD